MTNHSELARRAARVRLVVLDVDGVLTDGSIWVGAEGELVKRFNVRDGLGIRALIHHGIPVAILSGRDSPQTAARCRELGITAVAQGQGDKLPAWQDLLARFAVDPEYCAYMGDDLPDLPVLRQAGLAAVPADASEWVRSAAHWVAPQPGGAGAVRALAELILRAQGHWEALLGGPAPSAGSPS